MKIKAIPEGYHSLTSDLVVKDVAEAIEFYKRAFGAQKRRIFHGSDGNIVHAEIQIGDSILIPLIRYYNQKEIKPCDS